MDISNLKKVIQAAVPEIMALKFGCEVQRRSLSFPGHWNSGIVVGRRTRTTLENEEVSNYTTERVQWEGENKITEEQIVSGNWKILGREIRLADVLLTMGDIGLASMSVANPNVDYGKVSFIWEPYGEGKHFVWNLLDDNLDHQSDECKQFLISLLCPQTSVSP